MKAQIKQNKLELESKLKRYIQPNDTIYTILKMYLNQACTDIFKLSLLKIINL